MRLLMGAVALSFLAAAQKPPAEARANYNRGVELQKKVDLAGARSAYEAALKLEPDRVETLANLGAVLLQTGSDAEAAQRFARVLKLRPELDAIRVLYGLALFRSGRVEEAAAEALRVLSKQPRQAQALHLLGLCRLRQERFEEGVAALEQALQAAPGNLDAAATLATTYAGLGHVEKSEVLLAGPLGSSERAEAYLARGVVEKARGNWVPASKALEEAVRRNPKLPTAHTELGHAYLLMGEDARAEREFKIEQEALPGDFHAAVYLGWLYLRDRRWEEALTQLATAARHKPRHPGLLYLMGQAEHSLGRLEQARQNLERSVEAKPDFLPAHVLLARVYAKLRRMDDARREQAIITRLNREEQERNLQSQESYGTRESRSLPDLRPEAPAKEER